jgi:hypothetical protein
MAAQTRRLLLLAAGRSRQAALTDDDNDTTTLHGTETNVTPAACKIAKAVSKKAVPAPRVLHCRRVAHGGIVMRVLLPVAERV